MWMEGCWEEENYFIPSQMFPKEEKPGRQRRPGKANGLEVLYIRYECKYIDCIFSFIHYKLWKNLNGDGSSGGIGDVDLLGARHSAGGKARNEVRPPEGQQRPKKGLTGNCMLGGQALWRQVRRWRCWLEEGRGGPATFGYVVSALKKGNWQEGVWAEFQYVPCCPSHAS